MDALGVSQRAEQKESATLAMTKESVEVLTAIEIARAVTAATRDSHGIGVKGRPCLRASSEVCGVKLPAVPS